MRRGGLSGLSPFIYLCVCIVCVSAKYTAVCCLTARKSPRNSSLPLGARNSYSSKDAYKVGRLFCRVQWPWFLIAARPRGGIEHYGNWVCRPTTSLRERCEHTHEGWRKCQQTNADRLADSLSLFLRVTKLRCEYLRPVVALEWHDHVDGNFIIRRNTEHDDSKKLPVMHDYVGIWNCQTLNKSLEITNSINCSPCHISDTIHKSLEITNALIAVHVTSLPGSLYVCFALCNCSRTHTDVLTWCNIVGYSTYYNSAPGMFLRTLVSAMYLIFMFKVGAPSRHVIEFSSH